jgi:hypothetical protein
MTVKIRVGTLAKGTVVTTASAARHPFHSAARVAGLVKGTAGAGVGLVRGVVRGPAATVGEPEAGKEPSAPAEPGPATTVQTPPGPDIVPKPVPTLDELPEPVVISAEDETPDPVHTEPKAASRSSAHGGPAGDREEIDGYVDEIEDDPAT